VGLDAIVRAGLKVAKTVTADLRDTVTHEAWSSVDGFGKPTYASGVSRSAIVEHKQHLLRNSNGQETLSSHRLLFLEPVAIDPRDRLTLSDGTTASILSVNGVMDPSTDAPYYAEVFVGLGAGVSASRGR